MGTAARSRGAGRRRGVAVRPRAAGERAPEPVWRRPLHRPPGASPAGAAALPAVADLLEQRQPDSQALPLADDAADGARCGRGPGQRLPQHRGPALRHLHGGGDLDRRGDLYAPAGRVQGRPSQPFLQGDQAGPDQRRVPAVDQHLHPAGSHSLLGNSPPY